MKQKTKTLIKILCFCGLNGAILGVVGVLTDHSNLIFFISSISGFVTMKVAIKYYKL